MRCRSEATETKRCAVGQTLTMRCRFAVRQPPRMPILIEVETAGRPKFLGNPRVPMPCSLTPAGPPQQALALRRRGPPTFNNEGSSREVISGLYGTASALAVYASPGGLPHRAQDSLLVAGQALPGGIRTRRVPTKGFQGVLVTSFPPFPSFLGAVNVPIISSSRPHPLSW